MVIQKSLVMVNGKSRKTMDMMNWWRVTYRKPMRWLSVNQRTLDIKMM